eukprot:s1200_g21.t1
MIPDAVKLNCDATSMKGFVSYLVRRHNGAKRRDAAIRALYNIISLYWPVKKKTEYLGGDEEVEVEEPAGEDDSIDDPVDHEDGGDAEIDLAVDLGVALAAPEVQPCPESQVPPETLYYSPQYSPSPPKDQDDEVEGDSASIQPRKLFGEHVETQLDSQPSEPEPVNSMVPGSPEISPTEIETTPKHDVVEIEDSPAKAPATVTVSKDPMPSSKRKVQHHSVQSCARPMKERTVPPTAPAADAIETLPLDMSPIAKEYQKNPPVEFAPDPLPPRKFAKFARKDSCATLPLGATSTQATMDETKKNETPDLGEPSEPTKEPVTSEPMKVGEPVEPTPDSEKPAESTHVGDGSVDAAPGDLFHTDVKITRVQQMQERDRLKNESKKKKNDEEDVQPKTKSEKATAAKEKKQLAKETNKKLVAEAKRAAKEAKKATKAAEKEKAKAEKAIARAKAKAKAAPKSKSKAKKASKEGEGVEAAVVLDPPQAETVESAEPVDSPPSEEKPVRKRAPKKNSEPVEKKAKKSKSTKTEAKPVEDDGTTSSPPAAPPVPGPAAEGEHAKDPAKDKKTFARRNRPQRAAPAARFDAIRKIFDEDIREKVKTPSSMEVP